MENTLLKNYPGILRRSKLAVERFTKLDSTNIKSDEVLQNVKKFNSQVDLKNAEVPASISQFFR